MHLLPWLEALWQSRGQVQQQKGGQCGGPLVSSIKGLNSSLTNCFYVLPAPTVTPVLHASGVWFTAALQKIMTRGTPNPLPREHPTPWDHAHHCTATALQAAGSADPHPQATHNHKEALPLIGLSSTLLCIHRATSSSQSRDTGSSGGFRWRSRC